MQKKITKATIKSFVNKNREHLYIAVLSRFDGMTDCIEKRNGEFDLIQNIGIGTDHHNYQYTLGIAGARFVSQGGNWFVSYEDECFKGFEISNCCGSFILAVKKDSSLS